jgi:dTDP-4-dehydrorhamnose reductase
MLASWYFVHDDHRFAEIFAASGVRISRVAVVTGQRQNVVNVGDLVAQALEVLARGRVIGAVVTLPDLRLNPF